MAFRPIDVKKFQEKAAEVARFKDLAKQVIDEAEDLVESAKKIDADVHEAEAALAEATSHMTNRDYRLAHDKAGEAKEKARRAYAGRVKAIVDSSAEIVHLARTMGAEVGDADTALTKAKELTAAEKYDEALDLARKSWKRTEKTVHEALNKSFSHAQSVIKMGKDVGKDVRSADDLLSRARTAAEAGDYLAAMNFTRESVETVSVEMKEEVQAALQEAQGALGLAQEVGADVFKPSAVLERALADLQRSEFDKALNSARQAKAEAERVVQKGLEARMAKVNEAIAEAQQIGGDLTPAQEAYADAEAALRSDNFQAAVALAKKAVELAENAKFQRVLATIGESREKFIQARNIGADISGAMEYLAQAREALRQGKYQAALDAARQSDQVVARLLQQFGNLEAEVRDMGRSLAEAEAAGVDSLRAKNYLERAKAALSSRDFGKALEHLKRSREEGEKAEYERSMEVIEEAEFLLTVGDKVGAGFGETRRLLEEAVAHTKSKAYRTAIERGQAARAAAEAAVGEHIQKVSGPMREAARFLGRDEESVRSLLDKADSAAAARDFQGAARFLAHADTTVRERLREEAHRFHEALQIASTLAASAGVATALDDTLQEAGAALEASRFGDVLALRNETKETLGQTVDALFEVASQRVLQARKGNIDIEDHKEMLKRAKLATSMQDAVDGLRLLRDAFAKIDTALRAQQEAYGAIASAAAVAAEARKKDVDVKEVLESLLEAKRAFEARDFAKAKDLAGKSKRQTERLLALYSSSQRIVTTRERIDLAASLGVDTAPLKELFDQAKEAMKGKQYDEATELSERVEQRVTQSLRERIESTAAAARGLVQWAREVGLPMGEQEAMLATVDSALAGEDLRSAADAARTARDSLETLRKKHEDATVTVKRAGDLLFEVEAMNVEARHARKLLEAAAKALEAGNLDEALFQASRSMETLQKERDDNIAKTIEKFEKAVGKAKRDGVEAHAAEKLLAQAREAFQGGRYQEALSLAMRSEAEVEKVGLQQEMASKAILTAEKKLRGVSVRMPNVEAALRQAKEAFEEGEYIRALDLAIKSGDEFYRSKEAAEEATELKEKAGKLLALGISIEADTSAVSTSLEQAAKALEAGAFGDAQAGFQAAVDEGVRACRERFAAMLSSLDEPMKLAAELRIDLGQVESTLSQARAAIDGEALEKAQDLVAGVQSLLHGLLEARVRASLAESRAAVDHASGLGTMGIEEALDLSVQGERELAASRFREALDLGRRAVARLQSLGQEGRFREVSFQAESLVANARKFGIDVKEADRLLKEAQQLRPVDLAKATAAAERSLALARAAVDAFTPKVEAVLEAGAVTAGAPSDATLVLRNVGKSLAKDVSVEVLGDVDVEGLRPLPTLRAKGEERLAVKVTAAAEGAASVLVRVRSHRLLDGKEYVDEHPFELQVAAAGPKPVRMAAEVESKCPVCRGTIKKGLTMLRCSCGMAYHEKCSERAGKCAQCGQPLT